MSLSGQSSECMHFVCLLTAGIPKNEIVNPNAEVSREQMIKEKASRRTKDGKKKEAPSNLTASVNTAKNTLGHNAVVEARDRAYQVSVHWSILTTQ